MGENQRFVHLRKIIQVSSVHGVINRSKASQSAGILCRVGERSFKITGQNAAYIVDVINLGIRIDGKDIRVELSRFLGIHSPDYRIFEQERGTLVVLGQYTGQVPTQTLYLVRRVYAIVRSFVVDEHDLPVHTAQFLLGHVLGI
ncbi:hypothetical protein ES708_35166 [subsurface metagenome]